MPSRQDLIATMRRHGICVLMPTYNNAGTLRRVVDEVLKYTDDLIVVNDGSTDGSDRILADFGQRLDLLTHAANRGKGAALRTGLAHARRRGFRYAITLDSDGQHYPDDIVTMVRAIVEHPGAMIIGRRDLSNVDINGKSSFANKFSNFWFRLQTGRRLADTQTGYRAYPLDRHYGKRIVPQRYEAELLLMVLASWHGVELVQTPIKVYYPPRAERVSHFRPALDFTRISILNTLLCVLAVVYGLPCRAVNALRFRRLFGRGLRPMTHRGGQPRPAALTLERLGRSLFSLLFYLWWSILILTPCVCLSFGIGGSTESKRRRLHKTLRQLCRVICRALPGARVRYEYSEPQPFDKPAVIVCNHQSHLDLPVLMALSPRLIFLTNDWVYNNPYYGKIIQRAEFLPVSLGMDALLPKLRDLRDRGYSIVVFPEGTRSEDCRIMRFHQGAFMLARELRMDILPMTLHGAGHFLPKRDFMLRRNPITLRILPRMPFERIDGEQPLRRLASACRAAVRSAYDDMVLRLENCDYWSPLVLYKYAYRGWATVRAAKTQLRTAADMSRLVDAKHAFDNVRIDNSGVGAFALLYALTHPDTQVWACEGSVDDHQTAVSTADLPANLHFVHTVWPEDLAAVPDCELTLDLAALTASAAEASAASVSDDDEWSEPQISLGS